MQLVHSTTTTSIVVLVLVVICYVAPTISLIPWQPIMSWKLLNPSLPQNSCRRSPCCFRKLVHPFISINQEIHRPHGWKVVTAATSYTYDNNNNNIDGIINGDVTSSHVNYPDSAVDNHNGNRSITDNGGKKNAIMNINKNNNNSNGNDSNIFDLVANLAAICLYQSHFRRDAIGKTNLRIRASSATNWIDDASAQMLQQAMDRLCFNIDYNNNNNNNNHHHHYMNTMDPYQKLSSMEYVRWFKSVPSPAVVDLTMEIQSVVNATITDKFLQTIDEQRSDFLSRLQCRLFVLPSGTALPCPLIEPPATLVFGKLLYGGITRYRLLGTTLSSSSSSSSSTTKQQQQRRVGVRTDVQPTLDDIVPTWIMYGGSDRMYESVDMGPAALLEVILYPRGQGKNHQQFTSTASFNDKTIMQLVGITWKPQFMFHTPPVKSTTTSQAIPTTPAVTMLPSGKRRNDAFRDGIRSNIGGLQSQIDTIVRRVLDGRVIRPVTEYDNDGINNNFTSTTVSSDTFSTASLEAEELQLLGLTPVRGLLLYGPPGCGKTALAREISRALQARAPKIVSAPELLDRWVGGSEKLVRQLFADAEAELAACNNDATKSALHVIVIDEIDAVFRKRTSAEDSGEATRSSVVNQILAKLDGVKAISNILVIGMTNRRELLDEALLRPGRLEVQIEIPLPDKEGRREILNVHFNALRQRGRLSRQLCNAIDGVPDSVPTFNSTKLLARHALERVIDPIVPITPSSMLNLATDSISSNIGAATNAITDNLMLASDVVALDSFSFPPGAIITDCVRLVRRTIKRRRNSTRNQYDSSLSMTVSSNDNESTTKPQRIRIGQLVRRLLPTFRTAHYDLASDEVTGGFSGADIAGLVRCAGSLALARARQEGYGIDRLLITLEDVKAAIEEVRSKV